MVVDLLGGSLGPAAQAMVERFGLNLTTIDVGWPAAAAISYGTLLGSLAIPIGIGINVLLLFLGLTKTLMVDMWNFWHAAFVASLVYAVTQDFTLGLYATATYLVMIYLLADLIAPAIKKFYGFPNITSPHGTSAPGFLVAILMPRMVSLLMEGLTPISEAANEFVQKRFPGREVNIGMDSALSVGHPAVLSSSLLLVPITILLAVILPGNQTLPFGDLATIPFVVCLMAAVFRGNIVRTVVGGAIYMTSIFYITSWVAPLVTQAAKAANFDLGGNTSITALAEGGLWPTWLFVFAGQTVPWIILTIVLVGSLAGLYYINKVRAAK